MKKGTRGVRTLRQRSALRGWLVVLAALILLPVLSSAQAWIQLAPSGGPPQGRLNASAAYISSVNRLLIFGGYPVHMNGQTVGDTRPTNDLWSLDGANGTGTAQWTEFIPPDAPGSPPRRTWAPGFYDKTSNRMIIFGGEDPVIGYAALNDVWVLTNADATTGVPTWLQLTITGPAPLPRTNHSAAYDPSTNRLIVYGGSESLNGQGGCPCNIYSDTWVLTNANGTGSQPPVWSQLSPTGTVPTLGTAAFAYDSAQNKLIVYGGYDGASQPRTDTWVLSNANGLGGTPVWTQLATVGTPQQSIAAAAGYDPATQRFFIFGGTTTDQATSTNAVYVLKNATGHGTPTWQLLNVSGTPPITRAFASGVYDAADNRFLIFGGQDSQVSQLSFSLNDSWVLTNANGIVSSQIGVTEILPNHGGNAGSVTAEVLGSGFQTGAAVKLSGGGADIPGANISVLNASSLKVTFALNGASPGARTLVVTNPDGSSASLTNAFTVQSGGAPQLWANLIGRPVIRIGFTQTFYAAYGNYGTIDVVGAQLTITVPSSLAPSLVFGNANGVTTTVPQGANTLIAIDVGRVPAGSSTVIPISLTAGAMQAPFQVQIQIAGH
jgi:hypothetical protein